MLLEVFSTCEGIDNLVGVGGQAMPVGANKSSAVWDGAFDVVRLTTGGGIVTCWQVKCGLMW